MMTMMKSQLLFLFEIISFIFNTSKRIQVEEILTSQTKDLFLGALQIFDLSGMNDINYEVTHKFKLIIVIRD